MTTSLTRDALIARFSDRILSETEIDEMLRLNVDISINRVIDKHSFLPYLVFNGSIELNQNDPEIKQLIELLVKYKKAKNE